MKTTILFMLASGSCLAAPLFTGPFGPDGTWNLYGYVIKQVTWTEAKRLAEESKPPVGDPAAPGHLVTITGCAENHFMRMVMNRQTAWCGLTDNERFGGRESGSHPREGWRWVTGEPIAFANWKPPEPDDWVGDGGGEDAVFIERYGRWSDASIADSGKSATSNGYIVEWETHSPKPVAGAVPLRPVWPAASVMPDLIPGKWNARWVSGFVKKEEAGGYSRPWNIQEASVLLAAEKSSNETMVGGQGAEAGRQPWLWLATADSNRQGWLTLSDYDGGNFQQLPPSNGYIGAMVGKIHVETAGTYTLAITAEDAFALRVGGLKWKSAGGDGYIDPLDPLTITQPYGNYSTKALGVIDLPAGDHLVEALWMVETSGSEFHVLSAPGVHLTEGSTSDWRPLGHVLNPKKIPQLGITEAGWTVDCSMGIPPDKSGPELGQQEGLVKLELDLGRITKNGLPVINFADAPETFPAHFPNASVFPNHRPGKKNEHWPLKATARIVVPEDGLYQVGLYAAGRSALRIKGARFVRFTQTAQGSKGRGQKGDTVEFDGQTDSNSEPKIVTEWELKKGECEIEILYVKNLGPGGLAVFSCPSGPYAPALLSIGGAKLSDDIPGLPHASAKP